MPSSARRERERANTRERIVETALAVLEADGPSALTMRRVASDMEYTAPIVYQHFANKDALVQELVAHGYRSLVADLSHLREVPDTGRRLLLAAGEYVRFAGRHPHLYEAMNGMTMAAEQRWVVGRPAYEFLQELLADWSSAHGLDLGDRADACEIVWGTLHGIASLGHLDTVGNERAQRLAAEALGAVLDGWRSRGAAASVV